MTPRKHRPRRFYLRRIVTALRKRFGIVRLGIPFVSQLNTEVGADQFNNDCGPASVCMLVEWIWPKTKVDPNHVFALIQSKDEYTSITQLMTVLFFSFGISNTREAGKTIEGFIDNGQGIIALILYSVIQMWELNPNSYFGGQHFVVVEGYKKDKNGEVTHVFVHDPLRPSLMYRPRKIPREVFDKSWREAAPVRTAIVTEKKVEGE